MLSRKCWLQVRAINGGSCCFFFKSVLNLSTTSQKALTQNADMVDYLINSLGFSRDSAISTLTKVPRLRPFQENAISVVNYLENLGLSKTHIRNMVSGSPSLLCSTVDKTLEPKCNFFRELGLSGSDLCKAILGCSGRGLETSIKPRVLYLRKLLGTDENVVTVLKKCSRVLGRLDTELVESNIKLMRNYGIAHEFIVKWIAKWPLSFFISKPEKMEEILRRVENDWGIPRGSTLFCNGVHVASSISRSKIDEKFIVLQSFGWSESEIFRMVRMRPDILTKSVPKIQKAVDYFINEHGYNRDYLASHPMLFSLSLEKRVKPRHEVLRILNEKKLNRMKAVLYTVLIMPESKFLKNYILPYKDILPDLYDSYMSKVEIPKIKSS